MGEKTIAALEQEIADTRARIKARLQIVSSPQALSELGDAVTQRAEKAKEEWVERARTAGEDYATSIANRLKEKAQQNPLAVASIAAGIGWKLWRDPPVASALIGLGAVGLMTGTPADGLGTRAETAVSAGTQRVRQAASDLGALLSDNRARNQILLGVAGLAVAAAVGVAIQRKGPR